MEATVDARVVEAIQRITDALTRPSSTAGLLGLDWRVVVEQNGKPVAALTRSRDHGITVSFIGAA